MVAFDTTLAQKATRDATDFKAAISYGEKELARIILEQSDLNRYQKDMIISAYGLR